MKTSIKLCLLSLLAVFSFGCEEEEISIRPDRTFSFDFEQNAEGWEGGMADFPEEWDQSKLEYAFAHESLPAGVNEDGMALKLSGHNFSGDLFLFMKKQITGLEPNHTYRVTFEVELASKYPEQSFGIGGSPGASVYLKAGGAAIEPMAVEEGDDIRMNIDKGNQAQEGEDMLVLGNIGIPGKEETYQLIRRDNLQDPIHITTDSNGNMWLIVGTDSGFEGTTTLYYNAVGRKAEILIQQEAGASPGLLTADTVPAVSNPGLASTVKSDFRKRLSLLLRILLILAILGQSFNHILTDQQTET